MSEQEIITLQFGNYSNFVGTHYWNTQKKRLHNLDNQEINHLKLYRELSSINKSEYKPRVICFEDRNNLKSLKEDGEFTAKQNDEDVLMQTDELTIIEQSVIDKNDLTSKVVQDECLPFCMNLNNVVTTWSDYMTYQLDSNSIQTISNTFYDGFSYYHNGESEYEKLFDDIEDKLHYWVEECNSIEGFQILLDMHDGFSGLSCKMIEDLRDEFEKKEFLAFINWPAMVFEKKSSIYRTLNVALTLQSLSANTSMFTLQSLQRDLFDDVINARNLNGFEYMPDLKYHTSAIISSVLDSVTLPWRKTNRSCSLADLIHSVTNGKWKLSGTSYGFPLNDPSAEDRNLLQVLAEKKDFSFLSPLFPVLCTATDKTLSQSFVLQKVLSNELLPSSIDQKILQKLSLNRNIFNSNPANLLTHFTERFYPNENTISKCSYVDAAIERSAPYPNILTDTTSDTVMSCLFTSKYFYDLLRNVVLKLRHINLNKHHEVSELGLDMDSMKELQEDLISLASQYDQEKTFEELVED